MCAADGICGHVPAERRAEVKPSWWRDIMRASENIYENSDSEW